MEDNNPTEGGTFEIFESAEAFQASMNQSEAPAQEAPAQEAAPVETQEAPVQETPYVDPEAAPAEPTQETFESAPEPQVQQPQTPDYSDQEIEGAVMTFLSERLGRDITSLMTCRLLRSLLPRSTRESKLSPSSFKRLDVLRKTGSHTNPLTQPRWMTLWRFA